VSSSPRRARRACFPLRTLEPSRRGAPPSPRPRVARGSRTAPAVARSTPSYRRASAPRAPQRRGRLVRGTGAGRAEPGGRCRAVVSGGRGAAPTRWRAHRPRGRGRAGCHRWRRSRRRRGRRAGIAPNRGRRRPPAGRAGTPPPRSTRRPPTTGRCRPPRERRRRMRRTGRAARPAPVRPVATGAPGRRSRAARARGSGGPTRVRFGATTPSGRFPRAAAPARCRGSQPRSP